MYATAKTTTSDGVWGMLGGIFGGGLIGIIFALSCGSLDERIDEITQAAHEKINESRGEVRINDINKDKLIIEFIGKDQKSNLRPLRFNKTLSKIAEKQNKHYIEKGLIVVDYNKKSDTKLAEELIEKETPFKIHSMFVWIDGDCWVPSRIEKEEKRKLLGRWAVTRLNYSNQNMLKSIWNVEPTNIGIGVNEYNNRLYYMFIFAY